MESMQQQNSPTNQQKKQQRQQYRRQPITSSSQNGIVCHQLPEMEVEKFQILEVVRCLLHTIIFHRALGPVQPRIVTSDLFKVRYCSCGSESATEAVESAINRFETATHMKVSPSSFRSEVVIQFLETKVTKVFGFTSSVDYKAWEEWRLPFIVDVTPRDPSNDSAAVLERSRQQQALELELRSRIFDIAQSAAANTSHVGSASVEAKDPVVYPLRIDIAGQQRVGGPIGGDVPHTSWNVTSKLSNLSISKLGTRSNSNSSGSSGRRPRSHTDMPTSKVSQQTFRQSFDENDANASKQKGDGYWAFKFFAGPPKIT